MSDSTTPQDDAAMSPASTGSVEARAAWDGVPVAWAAVAKNGQPLWLAYNKCDADGAVVGMAEVVPLYRSPSLTDAERQAIWAVAEAYAENDGDPECEKIASIMQGLWQRTK